MNHIGSGEEEGEKRQQSQREDEVINPLRLKCFFRLESSSDVHTNPIAVMPTMTLFPSSAEV